MKLKPFSALLILSITFIFISCSTLKLKEHTVKNEYSISVPQDFVEANQYPERFSFACSDKNVFITISVEGDPKAAYEERRTKDGTLAKYPYTLKGFSDFLVDDSKKNPGFRLIAHKESTINGMPAVIDEFEHVLSNTLVYTHVASVQSPNGMLYRIMLLSQKGKVSYAEDVFNSFKMIK